MSNKIRTKVTATASPSKKAIKPKMGRGTGGYIVTSVKLKVEKDKKQNTNNNG